MPPTTADEACPFCALPRERIIAANELALAVRDAYPVTPGHTLIITRRHVESWFGTTAGERLAIFELAERCRVELEAELEPEGYNLGVNVGAAAGQTVMHVHVHLIPRFKGDVEDPTGGIRNVIPGKANYRK